MASEFWGTGVFGDGARLAINFAFDDARTRSVSRRARRWPIRAATRRCESSARSREGILRKSFLRHGEFHDQALWTLLAEEWQNASDLELLAENPLTSTADMDVRDFDFDLPPELIAQEPPAVRGGARLLLPRPRERIAHAHRSSARCPISCAPGDLVVVNNTRVFPARLLGRRDPSGGAVECLLRRVDGSDPDLTPPKIWSMESTILQETQGQTWV